MFHVEQRPGSALGLLLRSRGATRGYEDSRQGSRGYTTHSAGICQRCGTGPIQALHHFVRQAGNVRKAPDPRKADGGVFARPNRLLAKLAFDSPGACVFQFLQNT